MKKTQFFVFAACLMLLAACAGSPKDNIVGTWKLSDVAVDGASEEEKKQFDEMKKMMVGNMEMTFNADGKYSGKTSMMGETKEMKGTWTISDDGKMLKTKEEGKEKEDEL